MEPEITKKPKYLPILITAFAMLLLTVGAVAGVWYYMDQQAKKTTEDNAKQISELQKQIDELRSNGSSTVKTVLTNDQIFQEVATKFNFTRSQVGYFRIWDQDKVQYDLISPLGNGSGTFFAYKSGNNWIDVLGGQGVNDCSVYDNIPEQYRPICTKGTSSTLYYANADRTSLNYPISTATLYIGE